MNPTGQPGSQQRETMTLQTTASFPSCLAGAVFSVPVDIDAVPS
jgi:hypothetical protein